MRTIKQLLKEKELVVGLMIQHLCYPWVAKLYADAGSDFIYIEAEHMLFNGADLGNFILISRLCGLPVVAKSSYLDRSSICKLLDAGVAGIQLPMSESADQLEQVVNFTKFPPVGSRASCPGIGNTDYEPVDMQPWLQQANEETTVIAHIESRAGLNHIDEILSVPGVDIMYIGTYDLSVSLGYPCQFDHPEIVAAYERLFGAAKEHGKILGMGAMNFQDAKPWIKKGVRFIETSGEIGFIASGANTLMTQFPGHSPKINSGTAHV